MKMSSSDARHRYCLFQLYIVENACVLCFWVSMEDMGVLPAATVAKVREIATYAHIWFVFASSKHVPVFYVRDDRVVENMTDNPWRVVAGTDVS